MSMIMTALPFNFISIDSKYNSIYSSSSSSFSGSTSSSISSSSIYNSINSNIKYRNRIISLASAASFNPFSRQQNKKIRYHDYYHYHYHYHHISL